MRHKTSNNQNARFDMVQGIAVQDRVNVEQLDDTERQLDVAKVDPSLWLPSEKDMENIQKTFKEIIKRVLCQQMKFFKDNYSHLVANSIPHKHQSEMKKRSTIVSHMIAFYF